MIIITIIFIIITTNTTTTISIIVIIIIVVVVIIINIITYLVMIVFTRPNNTCSFVATTTDQTDVQLKKKFDKWEYSWWKSLNKRMPWVVASGSNGKALLSTTRYPTYYPSGSILWEGSDRHPADWIQYGGMRDPGVIWYWVNEDDCDADRKPGGAACLCSPK